MAEIDVELNQIDQSIHQLKIEWDKYFGGVERKPPNEMMTQVANLIRKYANTEIRNNAARFRYQSLATRFSTFSELWTKRLRALEEGRPMGVHGIRAQMLPPPQASGRGRLAAESLPAAAAPASEYRVKDPAADALTVRALFDSFVAARQTTGETEAVPFEKFARLINQQTTRLRTDGGAQAVDFRLETKDGKVTLKAKPIK
ncbi:MAG: hypothetical protein MUF51_05895 [Vicinamibacteria bacterium]|jgi:hypothetical protein|nr:hypothetical protein [Vicinamibacteria bacterium]